MAQSSTAPGRDEHAVRLFQAERTVLGSLLLGGPDLLFGTADVKQDDFGQNFHRAVFCITGWCQQRYPMCRPAVVADEVRRAYQRDDAADYVIELADKSASLGDVHAAVGRIRDAAYRRCLSAVAGHLRVLAADTAQVIADISDDAPSVPDHGKFLAAQLRGLVVTLGAG